MNDELLDVRLHDLYEAYDIDLFDADHKDIFAILVKIMGICNEIDANKVNGICEVLVKSH